LKGLLEKEIDLSESEKVGREGVEGQDPRHEGSLGFVLGDDERHELIPVWPHKRFAEVFTTGCWNYYEPRAVNLDAWMERYLPNMNRDDKLLAVFPVHEDEDTGVRVSPERFSNDLSAELALYE
jgi:hypothetical protein